MLEREPFDARIEQVLVLADSRKADVGRMLTALEPWLGERVTGVQVEREMRDWCRRSEGHGEPLVDQRPDLVIVLGGDGSILSSARVFADEPVPTIGVNFGRVGFLASVRAGDWEQALEEVFGGRSVLEPRMRLIAELRGGKGRARDRDRLELGADGARPIAMNDVVVSRGAIQGMLTLSLSVGEQWVSDYRSDGLIVATPSGSTAHSLAAGGPILAPSMRGIVATPICPQSLSHRALVLHPDSVLKVHVETASGLTTLAVDGQGFYPMRQGDTAVVRRHPVPYPLLARPGSNPYRRLRERLGWRGSFEPGFELEARGPAVDEPPPGEGELL